MAPFEKMFDRISAKASPNLRRELEEADSGEFHNSNLYDQNEDPNGDLIDPATGKAFDNTTMPYDTDAPIHERETLHLNDDTTGDDADTWLKANDPEYKK